LPCEKQENLNLFLSIADNLGVEGIERRDDSAGRPAGIWLAICRSDMDANHKQEVTVAGKLHGQAVLQRRVLD